ncbi:thiol:disulfide interchange protein DsbA/DsbL [Endozoicomonas montiporae]|nr:thiol:disulfide interchange protein DsbA/DsbL [Endozoicomonas montiporae]AMO54616.1 disulfide bond formation protein A [Endozoicomonas montiporae CL-33]
MKKILSAVCLTLAMPLSVMAASFSQGTHYNVLPDFKKSETPEVREAFSVYCPACYQWDQGVVGDLQKRLELKDIPFNQSHVAFMGNYADKISQALAITKGTEKYTPVKKAIFKALQEDRIGDWKKDEDFFKVLAEAGLSKREWTFGVNDPVVRKRMKRWSQLESSVRSVPSFIVNNKYIINLSSIKSFDEFYSLIDYLLEK